MNLLLNSEAEEYVLLLINAVSMTKFNDFIKAISKKYNWHEELCCCYFETNDNDEEYYRFETFEGDSYRIAYESFLSYVRLAIIRYYLGIDSSKSKETLKEVIKNTVFESTLDNVNSSLAIDFPLIG